MEDWNVQTRKEAYSRLYNRVWSIGYKDWNRQVTCYLLVEEEYASGYNQDNTGIPTNNSSRKTQRIEDSNYINRTRIWVYRRVTRL